MQTAEKLENNAPTLEHFLAQGHTPMMAQYHVIKGAHPDCLKTDGTNIPMCGVPFHSYEGYLAKLIRAGHKVAISEQTETPDQAKARAKREGRPTSKILVNREVVRIVTQGTLTEDHLLEARENNYITALSMIAGQYGLAWLEMSTGAFTVQTIEESNLPAALERIDAREILIPENLGQAEDKPASRLYQIAFLTAKMHKSD